MHMSPGCIEGRSSDFEPVDHKTSLVESRCSCYICEAPVAYLGGGGIGPWPPLAKILCFSP